MKVKFFLYVLLLVPFHLWSQSDFEATKKLFDQGKYVLAKPQLETYLQENPNHTQTIEYLGDIAIHNKQWDEAIGYFKKLKNQFPKKANYYFKYGKSLGMKARAGNKLKALSMVDDIRTAFETAAKLDPKHVDARWALVIVYTELPGIVGGSEVKAQKYSDELMKISPVDGYLTRGYMSEYDKRYKDAEKHYLKAIEIGQSKVTYQRLADLYKNKMNSPEKAKQILDLYQKKKS